MITFPLVGKLSSDMPLIHGEIKSIKKLLINGQEKSLTEFTGEYKDGIYYYTSDKITFIEKNLTDRLNTISLKVDGLSSNSIAVKKE